MPAGNMPSSPTRLPPARESPTRRTICSGCGRRSTSDHRLAGGASRPLCERHPNSIKTVHSFSQEKSSEHTKEALHHREHAEVEEFASEARIDENVAVKARIEAAWHHGERAESAWHRR